MSTKVLIVLSLLMIIIAGYFYASNNATLSKPNLKPSDIDYQASNVDALQTDSQGKVNYRLKASQVTHYQNAKIAVLDNPVLQWQSANQKQVELTAQKAELDETGQIAQLSGNVLMKSQSPNQNNLANPIVMTLKGQDITSNLLTKEVTSTQPIAIQQGDNQFSAQHFSANANTGDYEFEHVSMTFAPPKN